MVVFCVYMLRFGGLLQCTYVSSRKLEARGKSKGRFGVIWLTNGMMEDGLRFWLSKRRVAIFMESWECGALLIWFSV